MLHSRRIDNLIVALIFGAALTFSLPVNAAMLGLVAAVMEDFTISGFFPAMLAALVVSLVSWMASWYVGPAGRIEVYTAQGR